MHSFPIFLPFTDASESKSEFKLDNAVRTNGWELRTDPGILKRKKNYLDVLFPCFTY